MAQAEPNQDTVGAALSDIDRTFTGELDDQGEPVSDSKQVLEGHPATEVSLGEQPPDEQPTDDASKAAGEQQEPPARQPQAPVTPSSAPYPFAFEPSPELGRPLDETQLTDTIKNVLQAADQLDPDADDFHNKLAEQWAGLLMRVQEQSAQEAVRTLHEQLRAQQQNAMVIEKAKQAIIQQGWSPDGDKEGPGRAFWFYANRAPVTDSDGNKLSIDDQIQWAIEQVKADIAAANRPLDDARRKAQQEQPQPLDRGAQGPAQKTHTGPPKLEQPVSLESVLEKVAKARKI